MVTNCASKGEIVVTFTGTAKDQGDAVVVISIDNLALLKFDVELFGLPNQSTTGHEVTVNFYAPNMDNEGVFYTDSNGLEMQKRVLNYRPTWNLTVTSGGLNVTANYYPVQTAIAIRD